MVSRTCTIILPCHNEEGNIKPLYRAIVDVVGSDPVWRLLFVDDGSTDKTLEAIKELQRHDARIGYLSFLVNYGHQKAILAGLRHCETDLAITMDADLQHPPRYIPTLLETLDSSGAHIVAAQREGRQGGLVKHTVSKLFYRIFGALTGVPIIPDASDFRLFDRVAIDVLSAIDERDPFLRGMIPSLRLTTAVISYKLAPRLHGKPSFSFGRSARMGAQAFLRFSDAPTKIGFTVGIVGVVLSSFHGLHYSFLHFFTNKPIPEQAGLIVLLSFAASLTVLLLSLILRVLGEVVDSLQGRPVYVIAESSIDPNPPIELPNQP